MHGLGNPELEWQLLLWLFYVSPFVNCISPFTNIVISYFLEQAGLAPAKAYDFALGQYGINMAGVFGAWFLMTCGIGRRALYLYGLMGLCSMLFILGFLGLVPHQDGKPQKQASLATGSIMLVWALFYQLSVGTVCYSLVAELSTRRLQIKTVVLGRNL